jgi:hypothetical protein
MSTPAPSEVVPSSGDAAAVAALARDYRRLRDEISKVIIGQESVVEDLLTGLLARGHVLLVGVPGLAKSCSSTARNPLWDQPLALIAFFGILTIEWIARKRLGLP